RLGLAEMRARRYQRRVERADHLAGENGAVVRPDHIELRSAARPGFGGSGCIGRTGRGTAAVPGVDVDEGLLDDGGGGNVADGRGIVQPGRIECRGRNPALLEEEPERAERIGRADIAALDPQRGQEAPPCSGGGALLLGGPPRGDAVPVGGLIGPAQRVAEGDVLRQPGRGQRGREGDDECSDAKGHPVSTSVVWTQLYNYTAI